MQLTSCIRQPSISGSCIASEAAATDHRAKYINRSVIIFGDHRRRLQRATGTRNKYPFPYSNAQSAGATRWNVSPTPDASKQRLPRRLAPTALADL